VKPPHKFDVEGLERVSGRLNEVDTSMDAIVDDICPVWFVLCLEVCIESRLNTFQNRLPTAKSTTDTVIAIPVFIIDEITESRGIDDIKSQSNAILLNIGTNSTDVDCLRDFHGRRANSITRCIQTRVEQGIH
jgi:hypothetical protein